MSLGHISCDGCTFSGYPHNEDCPEALTNKYPRACTRPHADYISIPKSEERVPFYTQEEMTDFVHRGTLPEPNVEVFAWGKDVGLFYTAQLLRDKENGKYYWTPTCYRFTHWMPRPTPPKE